MAEFVTGISYIVLGGTSLGCAIPLVYDAFRGVFGRPRKTAFEKWPKLMPWGPALGVVLAIPIFFATESPVERNMAVIVLGINLVLLVYVIIRQNVPGWRFERPIRTGE